jgi:uncharacterized delta-60 repeat protein
MRPIPWRAASLALLVASASVSLASGGFDPSFGTLGTATMAVTNVGGFHPVARTPDEMILGIVGVSPPGGSGQLLYRAFSDGTVDTSFGTQGALSLPTDVSANSVSVAQDGSIYVVGTKSGVNPAPSQWAIRRLHPDGTPDTSFGTGGLVLSNFATGASGAAIIFLASGKLLVVGGSFPTTILARYATDGTLDTTFGSGGSITHQFGGTFEYLFGFQERPDGRLVASLASNFGSPLGAFAVAQFQADGTRDPSFGTSGVGYTKVSMPHGAQSAGIALQPDGRILLTGDNDYDIPARNFTVLRFLSDGSLDPSFGTNGIAMHDFAPGRQDESRSLALLDDGRFLVIGQVNTNGPAGLQIAAARYLSDGSVDPTFGIGGLATAAVDDFSQPQENVRLADGDLILAGSSFPPAGVRNFLLRLIQCAPCDVGVANGCATAPVGGCRQAGAASLRIRDDLFDKRDLLVWKHKKGPDTVGADFGAPTAGDRLTLCLYGPTPLLPMARTSLGGGGTCSGRPCWKGTGNPAGAKGFKLKDANGLEDGLTRVVLGGGTGGRTSLSLSGKGPRLRLPTLPLATPLHVRLQSSTGACWDSVFSAAALNTTSRFEASTP